MRDVNGITGKGVEALSIQSLLDPDQFEDLAQFLQFMKSNLILVQEQTIHSASFSTL